MIDEMRRDEHFASIDATTHRPRRQPQRQQDHVFLSMEDYVEQIRVCLLVSFTIVFRNDAKQHVASKQPFSATNGGFDAD